MPKTPHRPVAHGAGLGVRDGDYGGAGWARCHLPEGRVLIPREISTGRADWPVLLCYPGDL